MTTLLMNRKHRHTRPAAYVSKACRDQQLYAGRPGSNGFSFTGEFPAEDPFQPVVASRSSRSYTAPRHTGSYKAVTADDTARMPAVCRHGVRYGTAMVAFAALFVVLASILMCSFSDCRAVSNRISARQTDMNNLHRQCQNLEVEIAEQSGDVNIRLEAMQLGLVSSRGKQVEYLQGPQDAVITLADNTTILSLASLWGQQ